MPSGPASGASTTMFRPVDITRIADRRIPGSQIASCRAAAGLNVDVSLEQGVEIFHARGGDLRRITEKRVPARAKVPTYSG